MNKTTFRTVILIAALVGLYGVAGMIDAEGEAVTAAQTADILTAAQGSSHE